MDARRFGLISTKLHYFQLVAEFGSIRRAAHALNVAPSVLSRSIRQIEADLDVQLFDRVSRRLKLTSAGETLLYHTRASALELGHALNFIQDLKGLRGGTVSIAAIESVARHAIPKVLGMFWRSHENVEVDIHVAGSTEAFESVANGLHDLAVAFDVDVPRRARRLASCRMKLGALLRPDHPLAGNRSVTLRDFALEPILLAEPSLTLGRTIEIAAAAAGVDFRSRVVTNSIGALIELARSGQGVTFQTRVGVEPELESGRLVFVPLSDPNVKMRELLLVARANSALPQAASAVSRMLGEALAKLDESDDVA
ncbi:LysR family transcriptional regulator [Pelagibacterium montanilacus]|uniref:LysR family transcriptional regulator n=1 Tax=Pelagibacterium montanilacus TaxID=2185280 RepID=UPI000F8E67AE|nr:LysR family transcriptional regulator [Pelagibacterium montanilacus]